MSSRCNARSCCSGSRSPCSGSNARFLLLLRMIRVHPLFGEFRAGRKEREYVPALSFSTSRTASATASETWRSLRQARYRTSTGNVRPSLSTTGQPPKYADTACGSTVADITTAFSSGRTFSRISRTMPSARSVSNRVHGIHRRPHTRRFPKAGRRATDAAVRRVLLMRLHHAFDKRAHLHIAGGRLINRDQSMLPISNFSVRDAQVKPAY